MTTRILVVGDPHFKVSNPIETEEMSSKIIEVIKKIIPDAVVVAGDILDRHESIHVKPLQRATAFLYAISQITKLYILVGNHDRPNNSTFLTEEHPFNAFKHWENTKVIDIGECVTINNLKCIMVPYVPAGRFDEALRIILQRGVVPGEGETLEEKSLISSIPAPEEQPPEVQKLLTLSTTLGELQIDDVERNELDRKLTEYNAIFAHQEFYGVQMGAIKSEIGDKWASHRPFVVSGHIHDYEKLSDNIIYTGTPIQHAFGDKEHKTISLYTWSSPMQKIPDEERIDLHVTKKIIVRLQWFELNNYIPPAEHQIKIIIIGTTSEIKAALESHNYKILIKKGVKIATKIIDDTSITKPVQNTNYEIKTYYQRFYETVANSQDSQLQAVWNEIFCG